jgi:hypothetical protein
MCTVETVPILAAYCIMQVRHHLEKKNPKLYIYIYIYINKSKNYVANDCSYNDHL